MNPESHRDIFEENLQRLLQAAAGEGSSDFQERLVRTVRQEVNEQRRMGRRRLFRRGFPAAVAAAAVVAALTWLLLSPEAEGINWLQPLYGGVEVTAGGAARQITANEQVRAGQSVRTLSGSKAQLLLSDGSKIVLMPRTTLQITDGKRGSTFGLQTGTVNIEAAKQRRARMLAVVTPGARVRTLGTIFDVRLVTRPTGLRQTRVGVTSGLVELESGGHKVLLGAHTEGVADEGQAPRRHLANSALDEMLRLLGRTAELAQQRGKQAGAPALVEFRDADVAALWTVVSGAAFRPTGNGEYLLRLKSPASLARLFTLEGLEVPVRSQGRDLKIDRSAVSAGLAPDSRLILELREVKGILRVEKGQFVQFTRPAGDTLTLLQFRLPGRARIERITPEPIESTTTLNRTVITVAADIQGLEVWE